MKFRIGIFLFMISLFARAEKVQDLMFEKKYINLEYAFYQGSFSEVEAETENLVGKFKINHPRNRNYFQILTLMARAQYLNSNFEKVNNTIEIIKKETEHLNDSLKTNGYLAVAEIYIHTNQPLEVLSNIEKASILKCSELQKNDLSLLKAWALYYQGFYNQSLALLESQEEYRKNQASIIQSNKGDSYFIKSVNDFNERRSRFFIHQNLKALVLTARQDFEKAKILIAQNKEWAQKNIDLNTPVYAQACLTEGIWNESKEDDVNASKAFTNACSKGGYHACAPGKVQALYKNALANIRLGNNIQTTTLLRELQMYAFRNMGWNEPFQPWYELAMSYKLNYDGDTKAALTRLEQLKKHVVNIPESHEIIAEYYNTLEEIEYDNDDLPSYLNNLNKFNQILTSTTGKNSPVTKRSNLQEAITILKFYGMSDSLQETINNDVNTVCLNLNIQEEEACKYFDLSSEYYFQSGKIDSALKYADKARQISSADGPKTAELNLYYNLKYAYCLFVSGKIHEANKIIREKEIEVLKLPFKENPRNIAPLLLLNELYLLEGDFEKSEKLRSTLAGFSGQLDFHYNPIIRMETDYAFAGIYKETNNFIRAQKHMNRALIEAQHKLSGTAFTIPLLLRSAQISLINGNYDQADKSIDEAMKIAENHIGKNTFAYANALRIQAEYFESIADYTKALMSSENARKIYESVLGPNNGFNINLILFQAEIKLKSAKINTNDVNELYETALSNAATLYSKNSEIYMNIAVKKAEFHITILKYKEAYDLLDKAQNYWNQHPELNAAKIGKLLTLKGKIYYNQQEYLKAEQQYEEAAKIFKEIFSINHPLYNNCKGDLARVYYMEKEYTKSLSALEEIIPQYLHYVEKLFPTMSFRQKSHYWNNLKDEFELYNFLVLKHFSGQKPAMIGSVYNNVISTKAILLSSDIKLRDLIATSGDSLLIAKYEEWVSQKELLTSAYTMSKSQLAEQNINLSSIEENIEQLEKQMGERSELFIHEKKGLSVKWEDIRKTLNENESVIEMVRLRYFNHTFTDTAFYAALILNKNTINNPDLVVLPGAAQLETKSYFRYRNSIIFRLKDLHSFKNYWQPLQSHLPSNQHIYFSPDGIYNQINPETFRIDENKFLSDEYSFTFLTNSKDILNGYDPLLSKKRKKEKEDKTEDGFIFVGNPEFYSISNEGGTITPLPGAEQEVKELSELLLLKGKKNQLIVGKHLTEDTIKCISNVKVLHIATHGFFNENENEEDDDFIQADQMLNSGVLFAGAGDIIDNNQNSNSAPGILTAYEAAGLKLKNTELVILSACETGRGKVKNGEGVFGLQRAFLLAGSNAVIMSLFKVDDEVTRKFMNYFYDNWLTTGNKEVALQFAKQKIKEQYPDPIYWGAFIMVESKPKATKTVLVK